MSAVRLHVLVHCVDHMRVRFAQVLELYRVFREHPRDYLKLPLTIQLCPTVPVDQKRRGYQVPVNPTTERQLSSANSLRSLGNGKALDYAGLAERVRVNLPLPPPLGDEARLRAETFAIRSRISSCFSFAFTDGGTSS